MTGGALAEAAARAGRPGRVLLHSARDDDGCGQMSYVASDPIETIEARGRRVVVRDRRGRAIARADADPLAALEELAAARVAIGYLAYDLGRTIERGAFAPRPGVEPDLWFGLWEPDAVARFPADPAEPPPAVAAPRFGALVDGARRGDYEAAVARALAYIRAGDVYQVNLARRLVAPVVAGGDALGLYAAVIARSACAFGAVLDTPAVRVVSASPERFLYRAPGSDRLETRPIKGTRRRTGDPARDRDAAAELAADAKERAEHLMIVDLERNDLGRVAVPGSVAVNSFARVVELPTLYHVVSTVSCRLRPGVGVADILRATFPGGSITGAPKVRAMQIIDELEPFRRGVYCGAIGRIGPGGAIDLSIAIRTATIAGGQLALCVGGGIVADSTAAREYEETEEKAAAWRAALAGDRSAPRAKTAR